MPTVSSLPDDFGVPDGSRGGLRRHRVDKLPATPLSDSDLAPLLAPQTVVEVWVPTRDPDSPFPQARQADGRMTAFRIEFADHVYAVEYLQSEADQSMGWYWALAPIWTPDDPPEHREVAIGDHAPLSAVLDNEAP